MRQRAAQAVRQGALPGREHYQVKSTTVSEARSTSGTEARSTIDREARSTTASEARSTTKQDAAGGHEGQGFPRGREGWHLKGTGDREQNRNKHTRSESPLPLTTPHSCRASGLLLSARPAGSSDCMPTMEI